MRKRFWVETIGCEVAQDDSYGDERWLEVRLPDGAVLILEQHDGSDDRATPGQPNTPVFLGCSDVDATWRDLADRGVSFVQEPVDMPFGRWALFDDGQGTGSRSPSRRHGADPVVERRPGLLTASCRDHIASRREILGWQAGVVMDRAVPATTMTGVMK